MIVFPAMTVVVALGCAAFVGWDAVRRPRPERALWTLAFLVFAIAAGCEVVGLTAGWSPTLARVYYLTGAVLVVGILALGEIYLLFPNRVPAVMPGLALLVTALAATLVWSARVDAERLAGEGWRAIERGPLLVALAVAINAGGTMVLAGGTISSAWKVRQARGPGRRAVGCLLIALGTVTVALGGTLTRFGRPEYLYLAMAAGIAIIFAGVLLTRPQSLLAASGARVAAGRPRLISLPAGRSERDPTTSQGVKFIVEQLLPLEDETLAEACRKWSATPFSGDAFTREQARQVWALRCELPTDARSRYDLLSPGIQAQLAELSHEVFTSSSALGRAERPA